METANFIYTPASKRWSLAPCLTRSGRANLLLEPGLAEAVEVTVKEAGINARIEQFETA